MKDLIRLVETTMDLLESGSSEGCEGLIVVDASRYHELRRIVHDVTGMWVGELEDEEGEDLRLHEPE